MIRTLYVGQQVKIVSGPTGGYVTGYLPVSSASCEVTKPVEAVTAFGHLGSLALAQTNLTTCKASIKSYLSSGIANYSGGIIPSGGASLSGLNAFLLSSITGDAVNGNYTVITVSPNGFTMSGIVTSIGIDMSLGGFGTCDFAFNGIGQPSFSSITTNATSEQSVMPTALTPITTIAVSGGLLSGCTNSFKFSLDMPTDILACLGDNPDSPQLNTLNSLIATKPPYKSSITVEGFGVDVTNTGIPPANTKYNLGGLSIQLPNAIVTSKSFNNAVGTANASYNYSVEDTTAVFGMA